MVKKYKKITISNSAQSFFQLWLPKYKLSMYRFTLYNLWKFQLFILNGSEMARPCVKGQQKCKKKIFFNSAQLFFQLWLPECKSSIYRLNIYNLWKFQLSISNGLEIKSVGMYKTWKSKQSWKKRVRVRKIDKNIAFGCT